MKIIDTQRQWAVVCTVCPPGPGDSDGQTWAFPGTDVGKVQAEAFAVRHISLQGHRAYVSEQYVVEATLRDDGVGYMALPLDADGERLASAIAVKVNLPTVFPGRPAVYYLATCQECVDMKLPFGDEDDRDLWADRHHKGTGHDVTPSVEVRPDQGE
ncbi:hypothetical protein [Mycobacteroides abscessus]